MLEIRNLSKRYGDLQAVDDVSFDVPAGRMVGFVGPNGAGKSTTMRSIFGLVAPEAGTITWNGSEVDTKTREVFGYMPEQRGLYPKMPIAAQVAYFAELKGVDRKTATARAEEILGSLDLEDRLKDPLEKLSHGNQQRVQLAVSLCTNPELLVLDEPFNGLDPVAVNTLQDVLEARVEAGTGVLFSSHQLDLVERLCDELVIILGGRIVATGSVHDVRRSAGVHSLEIELAEPAAALEAAVAPFASPEHLSIEDGRVASLTVTDSVDLEAALAAVRGVGDVTRFDYGLPSLQDVFTELAVAHSNGSSREEVAS